MKSLTYILLLATLTYAGPLAYMPGVKLYVTWVPYPCHAAMVRSTFREGWTCRSLGSYQ